MSCIHLHLRCYPTVSLFLSNLPVFHFSLMQGRYAFSLTSSMLLCCRVHESKSLCSVIENHLKPSPWNHKLKQFCEEPLDSLKFFIRKYPKVSFFFPRTFLCSGTWISFLICCHCEDQKPVTRFSSPLRLAWRSGKVLGYESRVDMLGGIS